MFENITVASANLAQVLAAFSRTSLSTAPGTGWHGDAGAGDPHQRWPDGQEDEEGRLRAVDLEGPLPDGQLLCPERRLGEIMFPQQDKVRKQSHSGLCVPDAVV